jgi:hypothetical protein
MYKHGRQEPKSDRELKLEEPKTDGDGLTKNSRDSRGLTWIAEDGMAED